MNSRLILGGVLAWLAVTGGQFVWGQTALIGDQFTVSFRNFPSDGGTIVNPVTQQSTTSTANSLTMTFDGEAERGQLKLGRQVQFDERARVWNGRAGGIPVVQHAGFHGETSRKLTDWANTGEIIEFSIESTDGGYIAADDNFGQSYLTVRGLNWAGAEPGSQVQFFDTGWYAYFTFGEQPHEGYQVAQPDLGTFIGPHPFDPEVKEVVYFDYGDNVQKIVDPSEMLEEQHFSKVGPNGLNLFLGTSLLDPNQGSWELLAGVLGFSGLKVFNGQADVTGIHLGFLIKPPVVVADPLDCNGDGRVDAQDLACACAAGTLAEIRGSLQLLPGDLDGNRTVGFADFLVLSENFGTKVGDYSRGDIDCNGEVGFPDFLTLAANFGLSSPAASLAAVPEPHLTGFFVGFIVYGSTLIRRRRH